MTIAFSNSLLNLDNKAFLEPNLKFFFNSGWNFETSQIPELWFQIWE